MSLTRTIQTARRPAHGRTTVHRDGTVTFWDIYSTSWERVPAHRVPYASLTASEAARIARIAPSTRAAEQAAEQATDDFDD